MELDLALALPNHRPHLPHDDDGDGEEEEVQSSSSSLLLWRSTGHPDHHHRTWTSSKHNHRQIAADMNEEAVGWPPAKSPMLVKVKMEGVPIGRKIDLTRCHSYRSLADALVGMFAKYTRNGDEDCTILYQDKEGDWLLAGDVPWEIFVESAERVKIVTNAD